MKREDCWMTFSEALESYLQARDAIGTVGAGRNRTQLILDMQEAAEQMDALTGE